MNARHMLSYHRDEGGNLGGWETGAQNKGALWEKAGRNAGLGLS